MAWLESFGKTQSGNEVAQMQFCQQCGRLDAKAAEELARACLKAAWAINAEDFEVMAKFEDMDLPEEWLKPVLIRLAELDPARALALMQHGQDETMMDDALRAVFTTVAQRDPVLAQKAVEGLADEDRSAAMDALTDGWAKTEPEAALARLNGMEDVQDLREKCIAALADKNPELALSTAIGDAMTHEEFGSLQKLINANGDMRAQVADWLKSYSGPDENGMRLELMQSIAGSDLELGMKIYSEIASRMTLDEQRQAARDIARDLAFRDRAEAQSWLDGLGRGEVRDAALASIAAESISRIGQTNILPAITGDDSPNGFPVVSVQMRTSSDLIPSANEASFQNLQTVQQAWQAALAANSATSPPGKWLEEMPPSSEKDGLIQQLIEKLQDSNPERALQWIGTLPDGDEKSALQRETELKQELWKMREPSFEEWVTGKTRSSKPRKE